MQALLQTKHADEASILSVVLQQVGCSVRSTRHLDELIEKWPEHSFDLIMLTMEDDFLPTQLMIQKLRAFTAAPIIVIADPLKEDQEVQFIEDGVDLVVSKPYGVRLLISQLRSLLRRTVGMPYFSLPSLTQGEITLDPATRTTHIANLLPVRLTQLEFRLLYTLMTHSGQVIPTENIVELVWGFSGEGNRELVRGLVQRLRAKIEPDRQQPKFIMTEQGVGYYFNRFSD